MRAFDGIMVARGDLGVELPLEQVPLVQKRAVQIARENARPVIVATQMLDSMIEHSRPTRAEASDVANAVLDGADAVMLSGETSVGKYPIVTVKTMAKIIEAVEAESVTAPPLTHTPRTMGGVLSFAARDIGERIDAKALVAFTYTGDTVRRLARLHTTLPVLAFTPREEVRNQLSLTWGVRTFVTPPVDTTDAMVEQVDQAMLQIPGYEPGDIVVIVAGAPPNTSGLDQPDPGAPAGPRRLTVTPSDAAAVAGAEDAWTWTSTASRAARRSSTRLVELLDLERLEDNLYRGVSPEMSPVRVFGGQVAAQALIAAGRTVPSERRVHSLHAYFLRPGNPRQPIVYQVDRARDGVSFTTRRVVAIQHGKPIFTMSASFQIDEPGVDHADPMPVGAAAGVAADLRRADRADPGADGRVGPDPAAVRHPLRRRPAVGVPADRAADRGAQQGLVPRRRRAARRRPAARVPAGLPVRPDAAVLGAGHPRAVRWSSTGSRWPRWTTRCGSTGRSGSTSGCCTTPVRPARPGARGLGTGHFFAAGRADAGHRGAGGPGPAAMTGPVAPVGRCGAGDGAGAQGVGRRRCTRCSTAGRRCCCARAGSTRSVSALGVRGSWCSRRWRTAMPSPPGRARRPAAAGSAGRHGRVAWWCGSDLEVVEAIAVRRPERIAELEPFHIWTTESVRRNRIDFRPRHELTAIVVVARDRWSRSR